MTARLYLNRTLHRRFVPFDRRFSHSAPQVFIDIDHVAEEVRDLRFLSHNRFNLFSFHDADHGDRSGAPLRPWAERAFAFAGVALDGGAIKLMTFPRVLGRAFNPLSIFFGYAPDGSLRGVIYEVNNTFGDTHAYVAAVEQGGRRVRHTAAKRLHVSPFFDVRGEYRIALSPPTERFSLLIENWAGGVREHLATLSGRAERLTDTALVRHLLKMPWAGLTVMASIQLQALGLWRRGAKYRRKPPPPLAEFSCATHSLAQREGAEIQDLENVP